MNLIESIFANLNLWLVMLAAGVAVYVIRLLTPDKVEEKQWFRFLVTILPLVLGAGLAMIPGLRPFDSLAQCAAGGVIGGSFASKVYEMFAKIMSKKIRHKLQGRKAPAEDEA